MWRVRRVLCLLAIYLVTFTVRVQSGQCCRDVFPFVCAYIPRTSHHSTGIKISIMKEQPHLHRPVFVKPRLPSVIRCVSLSAE
jgi:hypothetical protein